MVSMVMICMFYMDRAYLCPQCDGPVEQLFLDGAELWVERGLQLQFHLLLLIQGLASAEGKSDKVIVILDQLGEEVPVGSLQDRGMGCGQW